MEPAAHLWEDLDRQERELKLEGKRLREIWHKINDMHRENAAEREEVEKKAKLNAGSVTVAELFASVFGQRTASRGGEAVAGAAQRGPRRRADRPPAPDLPSPTR